MRRILNIVFISLPLHCLAQLTIEDSIQIEEYKSVVESNVHDTVKVNALYKWDGLIYRFDIVLDHKINRQIDSICDLHLKDELTPEELYFYRREKATANNNLGYVLDTYGLYDSSIYHFTKSIHFYQLNNDKEGVAKALSNCGNGYNIKGEHAEAIRHLMAALRLKEEIGDLSSIAATMNSIGNVYMEQQNFKKASYYFNEALKFYTSDDNIRGMAGAMINLSYVLSEESIVASQEGDTLLSNQLMDSAFAFNVHGIKYAEESGDVTFYHNSLNNMGVLYGRQMNLDSALYYYSQALESYRAFGDPLGEASALINIGDIYFSRKEYSKALEYLSEGYEIAQKLQTLTLSKDAAGALFKIYDALGNDRLALKMHKQYVAYKDSLHDYEEKEEILNQEYNYRMEKQHLADSLDYMRQQQISDIRHQSELNKEAQQRYFLYAGLGFVLLLGGMAFRGYRRKKQDNQIISQQKDLVEEKNQEILDSITYAKRIQTAILPPDRDVKRLLPKSFILYKPKDIVAGDFYWMQHKDDQVLFAAADCTGHGVPGAMVSVVCNNGLNRSVREHGLTDPGQILDKTREIVIQEFEKSEEEVKDGMDIALCSLRMRNENEENAQSVLKFAGAHNPLWVIRKGTTEVEEFKADKQPIGKFGNALPFNTHEIHLKEGDSFYIFSDGFADQFGGEKGKKFKAKNFKDLLLSVQDKSMEEQKEVIDEAFAKWKGHLEQLDDVCVIGVRV